MKYIFPNFKQHIVQVTDVDGTPRISIKLQSYVRIKQDKIWYQVKVTRDFATIHENALKAVIHISNDIKLFIAECYKVKYLYYITPPVNGSCGVSESKLQISEKNRIYIKSQLNLNILEELG